MSAYSVAIHPDGGYAVEIQHPDRASEFVGPFANEEDANEWMIVRQRADEGVGSLA